MGNFDDFYDAQRTEREAVLRKQAEDAAELRRKEKCSIDKLSEPFKAGFEPIMAAALKDLQSIDIRIDQSPSVGMDEKVDFLYTTFLS